VAAQRENKLDVLDRRALLGTLSRTRRPPLARQARAARPVPRALLARIRVAAAG
jgi:hypothetical protein